MRFAIIGALAVLPALAAVPAEAAPPNSITALLGPGIGYLLGQSDLCQWNLTDKIDETYKAAFQAIGMTPAQQAAVWEEAKARRNGMAGMPADAKERMKADTCTPALRARIEQDLTD
jgi:hypothetical protein